MRCSVFISYRREGGEGFAQMFSEKLKQKKYRVFYDIESIGAGMFDERILREIEETDVFLLILTKGALDRCRNEGDWVRREIAYALVLDKPIIPLFFRGFEFPAELPAEIERVSLYNGVDIRDMNYLDSKLKQLCNMIDEAARDARTGPAAMQKPARPTKMAVAAPTPAPAEGSAASAETGPERDVSKYARLAEWYYRRAQKMPLDARFLLLPKWRWCMCKKYYYYLRAAELGHSGALEWLAEHIDREILKWYGVKGPFRNTKLGRMRERFSCAMHGRKVLGEACEYHFALWSDTETALRESAEMGYIPAQMTLADWYMRINRRGFSGETRRFIYEHKKCSEDRNAFYWYMQVAEQGVGLAHFRLGELYMDGKGVNKNPRQAVHHFRIAAMKGDRNGRYMLGYCLEMGNGVPEDRAQARYWYKLAAEQGHEEAQRALVSLID